MIRHVFLIAYRSLMRNKSSSLINLIGLSTGLACTLMIYLWVQDELNFNHLDTRDDRRHQVFTNHKFDTGIQTAEATTGMLVQTMPNVIPEIEYAVCYHHFGSKIPLSTDEARIRSNGVFASKDFFKVFNFPLLSGKTDQVLSASDNMAISETLATRLFGRTDELLGKAITVASGQTFYVSGVYRTPINTQLNFDFMISFDELAKKFPQSFSNWGNTGPRTFLLLKEHADIKPVSARLKKYLNDQAMIYNA
jgi:putative ABC transport system permease protein